MGDLDPRPKLPRKPIHSPDHPVARRAEGCAAEDGIVFRAVDEESQSESGACSPTLWGSTSSSQFHRPRNRSLSPTSRTQAIARGQKELMDMVRNMPESSYELSLKDLVEYHHHHHLANPDTSVDSTSETSFRRDSSKKSTETRALVTRSRSVDSGGFYLKMFFPLPFGPMTAKKKRNSLRSDSGLNCSARVSPKPPPLLRDGSGKAVDRDWWRKRSSVAAGECEGSVSGGSMSSSGSSNSTSSRNAESQGSCWFCISPTRTKDPE